MGNEGKQSKENTWTHGVLRLKWKDGSSAA